MATMLLMHSAFPQTRSTQKDCVTRNDQIQLRCFTCYVWQCCHHPIRCASATKGIDFILIIMVMIMEASGGS